MKKKVKILYFPGTNCQRETAYAFSLVGASVHITFLDDLVQGRSRLDDADLLCIPGGFSFGDHVGAGNIAAQFLATKFQDQLERCKQRPILCICNGFQIGLRAGIFGLGAALAVNDCGTFRHIADQRHLIDSENASPWLHGLHGETLQFPCAHAEGRFIHNNESGDWMRALFYPGDSNPDGSQDDIAGITTRDGLALGLMDHPERALYRDCNLELFRNGLKCA